VFVTGWAASALLLWLMRRRPAPACPAMPATPPSPPASPSRPSTRRHPAG
jgi:hypothetical protein